MKTLVLALILTACATDPQPALDAGPDTAEPAPDAAPRDPRADAGEAYCRYLARCFPAGFPGSYGTLAHCYAIMPGYLKTPPAGLVTTCAADFDAEACTDAIEAPTSCEPYGFGS
jgi:hypothetical protein